MRCREILDVKKVEPLTKDLRLMFCLDAEPEFCVHTTKALYEIAMNFFIPQRRGEGARPLRW
jgi:hypothetical protein